MVNFNPIDSDNSVRWQSDLENTKERPFHKIKGNLPHWAEFEILRTVYRYKWSWLTIAELSIGDINERK